MAPILVPGESDPGASYPAEVRAVFDAPGDNNTGSTGHWLGSVVTNDITVQPNNPAIGPSASMFLDNNAGQVWEFFCDGSGNFGVYDKTGSQSRLAIVPSSALAGHQTATFHQPSGALTITDDGAGFSGGNGFVVQSTATSTSKDVGFSLSAHNGSNLWQFSARDTNEGDGTLFGFFQNNGSSYATVLTISRSCQITLEEGGNFVLGTTTGTKIGTAGGSSGQKLGFYNATPVTQPLLATGASHTVDDVITTLQTLGLVRQT